MSAALIWSVAGCSDNDGTDVEAGRRFCERLEAGEPLVDIALSEPFELAPGEYEDLVAERVRRFCPEQAETNEDVRLWIGGPNLALVDGSVVVERSD